MAGLDLTRAGHSAEMSAHREPRHETRNDHNRARRELTLFLAKSRNMLMHLSIRWIRPRLIWAGGRVMELSTKLGDGEKFYLNRS